MKYDFPIINNISDVLPALQGPGGTDFIVVKKDDYTVINYVITSSDTFPPVTDYNSAVRRECRGMIFDTATGKVLARRLHKFFNMGEHPEVAPENINCNQKHWILEKLDGSMITPFMSNGQIRWGTKMGLTDVSAQVEEFLKDKPWYNDFANYIMKSNGTPIFEWCSRSQRIVLDYSEDQLVLIALRYNIKGTYEKYEVMKEVIKLIWPQIPVVQGYSQADKVFQFGQLVWAVREMEDKEGIVIRFEDGHMIKVKSNWYLRLHRTKSMIESEKDVCLLILNNQLDDLLPVLMDNDKNRVIEYRDNLFRMLDIKVCYMWQITISLKEMTTRKDFALGAAKHMDPMERAMIFTLWDFEILTLEVCRTILYNTVMKHCGSNKSFEKLKGFFLKGITYE